MKPTPLPPARYPFATIASYGPDNRTATKLVVGVFKRPGQKEPDPMHRWFKPDGGVDKDPGIAAEIAAFLKELGVKQTVMADRIMGCPHEEGVDYPEGGTCPRCPFWKDIDRFTHEPKTTAAPGRTAGASAKVGRNDPCPCGSGKKFKMCCGK